MTVTPSKPVTLYLLCLMPRPATSLIVPPGQSAQCSRSLSASIGQANAVHRMVPDVAGNSSSMGWWSHAGDNEVVQQFASLLAARYWGMIGARITRKVDSLLAQAYITKSTRLLMGRESVVPSPTALLMCPALSKPLLHGQAMTVAASHRSKLYQYVYASPLE